MTTVVRVMIQKGTRIFSTHPRWPAEGKPAGRTYPLPEGAKLETDRIVWAGASGYWKWIKL